MGNLLETRREVPLFAAAGPNDANFGVTDEFMPLEHNGG